MKYRYKKTVDAIKLEKGMEFPDWLMKGIDRGEVMLKGISRLTRDEPSCEISNVVAVYLVNKGEYIIYDGIFFYAKPEEEFNKMFEKVK